MSVGVLVALTVSGCATDPTETTRPTRSTSSTHSTNLASAIDAYTRFNAAFDLYLSGEQPEDALEGLVTSEFLDGIIRSLEENPPVTLTEGSSSFSDEKLIDTDVTDVDDDVALVVCRDVSRTTIVDARTGEEASPPDRQLKIPLVVSFVNDDSPGSSLVVAEVEQWNEESYCE